VATFFEPPWHARERASRDQVRYPELQFSDPNELSRIDRANVRDGLPLTSFGRAAVDTFARVGVPLEERSEIEALTRSEMLSAAQTPLIPEAPPLRTPSPIQPPPAPPLSPPVSQQQLRPAPAAPPRQNVAPRTGASASGGSPGRSPGQEGGRSGPVALSELPQWVQDELAQQAAVSAEGFGPGGPHGLPLRTSEEGARETAGSRRVARSELPQWVQDGLAQQAAVSAEGFGPGGPHGLPLRTSEEAAREERLQQDRRFDPALMLADQEEREAFVEQALRESDILDAIAQGIVEAPFKSRSDQPEIRLDQIPISQGGTMPIPVELGLIERERALSKSPTRRIVDAARRLSADPSSIRQTEDPHAVEIWRRHLRGEEISEGEILYIESLPQEVDLQASTIAEILEFDPDGRLTPPQSALLFELSTGVDYPGPSTGEIALGAVLTAGVIADGFTALPLRTVVRRPGELVDFSGFEDFGDLVEPSSYQTLFTAPFEALEAQVRLEEEGGLGHGLEDALPFRALRQIPGIEHDIIGNVSLFDAATGGTDLLLDVQNVAGGLGLAGRIARTGGRVTVQGALGSSDAVVRGGRILNAVGDDAAIQAADPQLITRAAGQLPPDTVRPALIDGQVRAVPHVEGVLELLDASEVATFLSRQSRTIGDPALDAMISKAVAGGEGGLHRLPTPEGFVETYSGLVVRTAPVLRDSGPQIVRASEAVGESTLREVDVVLSVFQPGEGRFLSQFGADLGRQAIVLQDAAGAFSRRLGSLLIDPGRIAHVAGTAAARWRPIRRWRAA
jgi:hypothetical protein